MSNPTQPSEPAFVAPPRTRPLTLRDGALPSDWRYPTMLAPMEGVGHPTFRKMIAEQGGVGILCTEFVRVHRADLNPRSLRQAVHKAPGVPLSVQVMGNEADKMAEAARVIAEAGADVVDINLGCPMPRVVRKGVGAAMLKDPKLLYEVLSAMREAVPGLLSAKIRAGYDACEDERARVVDIAKTVEAAGVDYIAVHPRRRCDFYEGVADWRIIRLLRDTLDIPVIGNGDVWYARDIQRMRFETGCAAVMVGRPALRNPWIFRQAMDLSEGREPFAPQGDDVVAHFYEVRERYAPIFGKRTLGKLKELARWMGRTLDDDRCYQREALRSHDVETLLGITEACFAGLPAECVDLQANGHLGLEKSGSALHVVSPADARSDERAA